MEEKNIQIQKLEDAIPNFTDKKLRQMAKKVCNGHQHAMRYQMMLIACFEMGKMVLSELNKIPKTIQPCKKCGRPVYNERGNGFCYLCDPGIYD